jgi:GMP synthase-like glutamine amidotransferase
MRVVAVVHQDDAGPGVFADAVRARGDSLEEWRPDRGEPAPQEFDALMVFGGAMNVGDPLPWLTEEKAFLREVVASDAPMLGVCLGAQLLAEAAGGSVRRVETPEIGWLEVAVDAGEDPVMAGLPASFTAFGWHSFEAVPPPKGVALASSDTCLQAFRLDGAPAWGIQFHAEVSPADMRHWIQNFHTDPDAAGLDPEALLAESAPRVDGWNELGRALCGRFLDAAERR